MNLIFEEDIEEIHTADAYFKNPILKGKILIVPYVNLGVSNHSLNSDDTLKFIDKSYIVFQDIKYLKINNTDVVIDEDQSLPSVYLGGENLNNSDKLIEIEVKSNNSFLQLFEDSNISDKMWIPVDTPNFPKNITFDKDLFFEWKLTPPNIEEILSPVG